MNSLHNDCQIKENISDKMWHNSAKRSSWSIAPLSLSCRSWRVIAITFTVFQYRQWHNKCGLSVTMTFMQWDLFKAQSCYKLNHLKQINKETAEGRMPVKICGGLVLMRLKVKLILKMPYFCIKVLSGFSLFLLVFLMCFFFITLR